jgi:hypothetical protein
LECQTTIGALMADITLNHETFAIVPVFNGKPPSDAIVWGSISEVMEYIGQTQARVEAEQRIAQAKEQIQADAKALQHAQKLTADAIPRITAMADAFVAAKERQARKDAAARKAAAEAAEAKRVQDLLDALPDPDDPDAISPDDGDLQSPKRPTDKEHLAEHRTESYGDLPEDIRKRAPSPHLGPDYEPNIRDLAHPQKPQEQPASISLHEV